ncbi:MAG: hypothetical protein MZU97_24090 [Bacillus subtilis]|nr:hypothetical protein [Bacillus subtilis]
MIVTNAGVVTKPEADTDVGLELHDHAQCHQSDWFHHRQDLETRYDVRRRQRLRSGHLQDRSSTTTCSTTNSSKRLIDARMNDATNGAKNQTAKLVALAQQIRFRHLRPLHRARLSTSRRRVRPSTRKATKRLVASLSGRPGFERSSRRRSRFGSHGRRSVRIRTGKERRALYDLRHPME